jgi:DNA-binding response OmpR family regulator
LSVITPDPKLHKLIVEMAVAEAGKRFDPRNSAQFAIFVNGPLSTAVRELMGDDAVEAMRSVLDPDLDSDALEESGVTCFAPTVPAPDAPRVLVVTCHAAGGLAVLRLLETHGYAGRCVADAQTAVAECASEPPDLVLADLDWLDVEAQQFVGLLREALGERMPPVVLLGRRAEAVPGAAAALRKPLDRARLAEVLDELLMPVASDIADEHTDIDGETSYDDGSLAQIVHEALDQIASREVRDAVIVEALERCGLSTMPEALDVLAEFCVGPLHATLCERLGMETADQVVHELEPFLQHVQDYPELMKRRRKRRDTQPDGQNPLPCLLLVDDDERFLNSLSRMLRARGFDVLCASDAQAALSVCTAARPQLVVADYHMPTMSGRQLAALMQLTLGSEAPPIVILTADRHAPAEMDWVARVLHKPIDTDELIAIIEEHAAPVSSRAAG